MRCLLAVVAVSGMAFASYAFAEDCAGVFDRAHETPGTLAVFGSIDGTTTNDGAKCAVPGIVKPRLPTKMFLSGNNHSGLCDNRDPDCTNSAVDTGSVGDEHPEDRLALPGEFEPYLAGHSQGPFYVAVRQGGCVPTYPV